MELKAAESKRLHDKYYDLVINGPLREIARHQGTYEFELPEGSLTARIDQWREDKWQVTHGIISQENYIEQADELMREIIVALEELVWQIEAMELE